MSSEKERKKHKVDNKSDSINSDRRSFLKKAGIGFFSLGTAATIPSVTSFDIISSQGLNYYDSDGKKMGVDDDGNLKIDQINSYSQTPNITVYEDDSGVAKAVTEEKTYNGEDIFDAAQKAIDSQLERFDRPGGNSENDPGPGNVHVFIKSGVYEVNNGLNFSGEEKYEGVESFTLESSNLYGAYILTSNINDEPVIKIDPEVTKSKNASDRWRGVEIKNLFLDNGDTKRTYELQSEAERDIKGIELSQILRLNIENVEIKYYEQALNLRNIWEGKVNNIKVTSSGDSSKNIPAILVEQGPDTFNRNYAPRATNHIELNHLRGGKGCEYAYIELTDKVEKCTINFLTTESSCPVIRSNAEGLAINESSTQVETGETFLIMGEKNSSKITVNGGYFECPARFAEIGNSSDSDLHISNAYIEGDGSYDTFQVYDGSLYLDNTQINNCKTCVNANTDARYKGDNNPNPFDIKINNCQIIDAELSGINLGPNNRKYSWQISDTEILDACKSGSGHPISISKADNVSVKDCVVSVDSSVEPRIGIYDGDYNSNLSVNNNRPGRNANISQLTNVPRSNSSAYQNRGNQILKSGEQSMTITHQLAKTPKAEEINITPKDNIGNWWISDINSNNFTINVSSPPPEDTKIGWSTEIYR